MQDSPASLAGILWAGQNNWPRDALRSTVGLKGNFNQLWHIMGIESSQNLMLPLTVCTRKLSMALKIIFLDIRSRV